MIIQCLRIAESLNCQY